MFFHLNANLALQILRFGRSKKQITSVHRTLFVKSIISYNEDCYQLGIVLNHYLVSIACGTAVISCYSWPRVYL